VSCLPLSVFSFDYGGLRVDSTFELPGLMPFGDEAPRGRPADIFISLRVNSPPAGRLIARSGGRYRLALEALDIGWLLRCGQSDGVTITEEGRSLQCYCPDPDRLPLLSEIIVRRILPRVSSLHGRLTIHGATLGDGEGATMLLGSSGDGKSTMTAALALQLGWNIFSDDLSVLDDDARHTVFTTMAGVSVWPESRRALGLPTENCRPLQNYEGKVWFSPTCTAPARPRPLHAIILLSFKSGSSEIASARQSGPAALVMASSQLFPFNPRDLNQIEALFDRVRRMVAEVPVYTLAYPRNYEALPGVIDAICAIRADAAGRAPT
jgi:hypothetical protein